jgi:acetyl-CoA carboxylase biotin carboxyl carrier protein
MSKEQILSPLPGIFYRRASPESEEFKSQGDSVCLGDVIGLAEVMKSFHEIKSQVAGYSINFLVEDGDAIMPGQVLAELDG